MPFASQEISVARLVACATSVLPMPVATMAANCSLARPAVPSASAMAAFAASFLLLCTRLHDNTFEPSMTTTFVVSEPASIPRVAMPLPLLQHLKEGLYPRLELAYSGRSMLCLQRYGGDSPLLEFLLEQYPLV